MSHNDNVLLNKPWKSSIVHEKKRFDLIWFEKFSIRSKTVSPRETVSPWEFQDCPLIEYQLNKLLRLNYHNTLKLSIYLTKYFLSFITHNNTMLSRALDQTNFSKILVLVLTLSFRWFCLIHSWIWKNTACSFSLLVCLGTSTSIKSYALVARMKHSFFLDNMSLTDIFIFKFKDDP